ncbi:flagellar type III secretion system pore protein FliP [Petroclostridium sp. X23]|uniref:flagellar type III secretion system pore protein FliP n=1 Tax=Petroclostridium sp. X23 TaxID=3045146 RepID=UPI0024ACC33C|nr:flagellar type III secretion system pore protein FliP [Petroclostridium sp. X23]WHH58948.1 flagellar type III secretion system pore protein FliP [Petroclostridium sp. X23]
MNKTIRVKVGIVLFIFIAMAVNSAALAAPEYPIPRLNMDLGPAENPQDVAASLQILFILTILSLAPAILIMMTSFTRIIIILSFLRNALGTQQTPPNQVLVGLALFLTLFIMAPIGTTINDQAIQPYLREEISQDIAIQRAILPLREFMLNNTREKDLALFVTLSGVEEVETKEDIPTKAVIPAFIISELKTAFQFGFLIYIPFLVIDMVVASTLMSMGMMMLPPIMISLPFKVLLFVMVDGWNLITQSIVMSFR